MRHTNNGKAKREVICSTFQWRHNEFEAKLWEMYFKNNMSSIEIAEYIDQNISENIKKTFSKKSKFFYNPKSVQRNIRAFGDMNDKKSDLRKSKESFNLAIKRGRVKWAYKDKKYKRHKLNQGLRYSILERDGFKCVKCGNTAETAILEVDHIIPVSKGGLSITENLQTLCHYCNKGKYLHNNK